MTRPLRLALTSDDLTLGRAVGTPGPALGADPGHLGLDADAGSRERSTLNLQKTAGNRAVAATVEGRAEAASRGGANLAAVQRWPGRKGGAAPVAPAERPASPTGPAIAAAASGLADGKSFGNHAEIHLALRAGNSDKLTNFRIDLTAMHQRKGGIKIRIQPLKFSWAAPESSTMWNLTDAQAMAAMARAVEFQGQQSELSYQRFGVGPKQYNCALFVQEILKAAGIQQSAGLVVSTPLEVAKGRKLPSFGKRKPKAPTVDANQVPRQYEV